MVMKKKYINSGLLLLRLSLGILMLLHGIAKLAHGVEGMSGMLQSKGIPAFVAYGVYLGEVVAPLLIIIGFRTRLAALVFAINMVVAVALAHSSDIFSLDPRSGGYMLELHAFYTIGSIILFLTGAGKYALSTRNKWD